MPQPRSALLVVVLPLLFLCAGGGCRKGSPAASTPEPDATAEDLTAQGHFLAHKRDWLKAIEKYDEAIRADRTHAPAFSGRAAARLSTGQREGAMADANESLRLDPRNAHAFAIRANLWFDKEEYDKSIKDFTQAIDLDPKNAVAFNNRGRVHIRTDSLDSAIRDLDEAIRLDPKYSVAFSNRGLAWSFKGDSGNALRDYNEAVRLDPNDASALCNRAWLQSTCPDARYRDGKQAVEDARRACELVGWNDPSFLATLAAAYAESGKFDDAIRWQEKALEDPTYRRQANSDSVNRLNLYRARKPFHRAKDE